MDSENFQSEHVSEVQIPELEQAMPEETKPVEHPLDESLPQRHERMMKSAVTQFFHMPDKPLGKGPKGKMGRSARGKSKKR